MTQRQASDVGSETDFGQSKSRVVGNILQAQVAFSVGVSVLWYCNSVMPKDENPEVDATILSCSSSR